MNIPKINDSNKDSTITPLITSSLKKGIDNTNDNAGIKDNKLRSINGVPLTKKKAIEIKIIDDGINIIISLLNKTLIITSINKRHK